jgi:hypothetical protein
MGNGSGQTPLSPEAFLPNLGKLHGMAQSSAAPSKLVLNTGLPKTGTLAMEAFLRCIPGYSPIFA